MYLLFSYHPQQQQQQLPLSHMMPQPQQVHHLIPQSAGMSGQSRDHHHHPQQQQQQQHTHPAKEMNKPKGRMSAYTFFVQKCRDEHRKAYPNENANFSEFSKKCAEKWKVSEDHSSLPNAIPMTIHLSSEHLRCKCQAEINQKLIYIFSLLPSLRFLLVSYN